MKVNSIQKVKHYDLMLNNAEMNFHFELMKEFISRNVFSPRGSSTGQGRFIFMLDESVCDEYERKMGIKKDASTR